MSDQDSLRLAISAIRAGRKSEARRLLALMLEADPRNEDAWLWMSAVVDTDEQRIDCLKRVLAINPANGPALKGLAQLRGESPAPGGKPDSALAGTWTRCPACGSDNLPQARVCSQCGGPLAGQAAQVASAEPVSVAEAPDGVSVSRESPRRRGISRRAIVVSTMLVLLVFGVLMIVWLYPSLGVSLSELLSIGGP